MHKVNFRHLCLPLFGCKNMHTESANIVIIINIIGIVVAFIACHMCQTCMSVFVCLLKYVSIPSNTNTNTTMRCSSNAFSLLSLCLSAWLAIPLSFSVSFSVAHYSSIRRDCEFTAQVARDNKRQQMEKKGKQAQMSTSNRERERVRYRKRGNVAQAVAIFTVVLHNFLAHYVD